MKFHLLDPGQVTSRRLDEFEDRNVFQTPAWLSFLAETQGATPIIAELLDGDAVLGYFTGLVFRRMGIRILGSPFPGWTTDYMGFNLLPGVPRCEALEALQVFAFEEQRCLHLEISDRYCAPEDGQRSGFVADSLASYETDLTRTEDELFRNMTEPCRRAIRKAQKSGVRIEEAHDAGFADDYFEQLKDVFAKQRLVPTYGVDRVRKLVDHLLPTGRLLLLRARDPDGRCIATGIYPAMNRIAVFWGNASYRSWQHLRPNELMHWSAMRHWKQRGVEAFEWGGGGDYKRKYGVRPISIPWFRKSRYPLLASLRQQAQSLFALRQRFMGALRPRGRASQPGPPGTGVRSRDGIGRDSSEHTPPASARG